MLFLRRTLEHPRGTLLHRTAACWRLHGIEAMDGFKVATLCTFECLVYFSGFSVGKLSLN